MQITTVDELINAVRVLVRQYLRTKKEAHHRELEYGRTDPQATWLRGFAAGYLLAAKILGSCVERCRELEKS